MYDKYISFSFQPNFFFTLIVVNWPSIECCCVPECLAGANCKAERSMGLLPSRIVNKVYNQSFMEEIFHLQLCHDPWQESTFCRSNIMLCCYEIIIMLMMLTTFQHLDSILLFFFFFNWSIKWTRSSDPFF